MSWPGMEEIELLRAALQDARDLAREDAPADMIIDVCDRALAPTDPMSGPEWGRPRVPGDERFAEDVP